MATVGSSPTRLSSVKSVFGGPNNLRAYLRGGSYVLGIANAYPNIVVSGTARLLNYAGVIYPVTYLPASASHSASGLGSSTASVSVNLNGIFYYSGSTPTWLLTANAADFDGYMLKTGGTNSLTGGTQNTWQNLATTRTYSLTNSVQNTTKTFSGTLQIRMNASPQTVLSTCSVSLSAYAESNQCPTCCFTPDTMVKLSDGKWVAIVEVQVGDEIATRTGSKKVTEVITRTNRVMYQITFMDGRILNASEDHPLYVVDKGYAAINPGIGGFYKDLGIPDQLYVGDLVLDSDGKENAIVSIEQIDYPHTVYTFMESEFYANGMLVY